MNIEDFKIGTELISKSKIAEIDGDNVIIQFTEPLKFRFSTEMCDLLDAQPCPKYRKFRKGDIVEPNEINSRLPQELRGCYRYEVIVGEGEMSNPLYVALKPLLAVNDKHLSEIHVNAAFLKLISPVEELEPYCVVDNKNSKSVEVRRRNPERVVASFYWGGEAPAYTQEEARKAAEAECARLNEEYRKENA